jgi:hypothetical protein
VGHTVTEADQHEAGPAPSKRVVAFRLLQRIVVGIQHGDDASVEQAILQLSRTRRYLAPLALAVGAIVMLFQGVKLLFTNWRLTTIQILPAMWIWAAMVDLKVHALHGKEFHIIRGPILVAVIAAIVVVTALSFYLNAAFAFAISQPEKPNIPLGFSLARSHAKVVLTYGFWIGLALGLAAMVSSRFGTAWYALAMGIVVGVMMFTYVAIPSRLIGIDTSVRSRRDKLTASAIAGTIGAVVCSPAYVIGRVGILLLGSHTFFFVGVILLAIGLVLQAGLTSAVKAIKMSAKLSVGSPAPAS